MKLIILVILVNIMLSLHFILCWYLISVIAIEDEEHFFFSTEHVFSPDRNWLLFVFLNVAEALRDNVSMQWMCKDHYPGLCMAFLFYFGPSHIHLYIFDLKNSAFCFWCLFFMEFVYPVNLLLVCEHVSKTCPFYCFVITLHSILTLEAQILLMQSGVSEVIYFVEKIFNNSDAAYIASHKFLSMAGVKVVIPEFSFLRTWCRSFWVMKVGICWTFAAG